MIIGLSGRARSGKDCVGTLLAMEASLKGLICKRLSFAQSLKEEAKRYGWDGKKDVFGRYFLQTLGQARRIQRADWWIQHAKSALSASADIHVFTDVRHVNEAQWIASEGGKIWRVERSGHAGLAGTAGAHISEVALNDWPFDHVITAEDGDMEALHRETTKAFEAALGSG